MRAVIIFIAFLNFTGASAQSLMGTSGWLDIPTADMQEDGTFILGGSYINKNYIEAYGGGDYDAATYYFNLSFLPFMEVNFGNTRLLNYDKGKSTVDRRFSIRIRAFRERTYLPAIVVGVHDVFTSVSKEAQTNQYFSSMYIVATKYIPVKKSAFGITLGYGFDVFRNNQYLGFFGGVSFSPSFLRQMKIIAEYEGNSFNLGGNILFFRHLFVYTMLQDFKYFSGGIAYRVYLLNKVKSKIRVKKQPE